MPTAQHVLKFWTNYVTDVPKAAVGDPGKQNGARSVRANYMSNVLAQLLNDRDWLLCDGAMGTNLCQRGLETGEAPDLWNISNPEKVMSVHQGFVDAGADIILTNSFGANALRL